MKRDAHYSETFLLAALLALVGGFQDAYSYIGRQHVFANAQTGNLILLGIKLIDRDADGIFRYALPVFCFTAGILLACLLRQRLGHGRFLHRHQRILLLEFLLLLTNAFIPFGKYDIIANSLISLSCAVQVENFKRFREIPAATTMCIGNIKSGMEQFYTYLERGDRKALEHARTYGGIILIFVIGAVIGAKCTAIMQQYAILVCDLILIVPFLLLFREEPDVLS